MKYPTKTQLIAALDRAGELHHAYEKAHLGGSRDEHWSGFYAAYVLGRYGDFQKIESLAGQLERVPVSSNWSKDAAETLLETAEAQEVRAEQRGQGEKFSLR